MKLGFWTPFIALPAIMLAVVTLSGCGQQDSDAGSSAVAQQDADHDHSETGHEPGEHSHEHGDEGHKDAGGHNLHGYWCSEHGVPEEICAQCNTKLAADYQKKGDWCEVHKRPDSQCFICHPELQDKFIAQYEAKFGEKPPVTEVE